MTAELPAPVSGVPRIPSSEDVRKRIGSPRRNRVPRWVFVLAGVVAIALVAGAVLFAKAKPRPTNYETAEVTRGRLEVTVTATGTLSAVGAVEVGSEVSGKVQKVLVSANERVSKGQVVAEIDPVQLTSEMSQANAQVSASLATIAQAEATANEARLARDRAEEQARLGLIAKKDLETARATDARAQAAVASAKANASVSSTTASTAKWKLSRTKIVAPIDGVVLARLVEPGQVVVASFQTPVLFRIAADLAHLELAVDIDEADVSKTKEGQTASFQVDAWPDRQFPAVLRTIGNEAKTTNGVVTYTAKLTVDNSSMALRPGMTASASIVTEVRENAILVPTAALRFTPSNIGPSNAPPSPFGGGPTVIPAPVAKDPHNKFVWVLSGVGTLQPVEVRPEATDGQKTAVSGNLDPSTKVVLDVLEGT